STIPLISAVGHETDTTLIDLAADRRAPTPTAAAEVAVPVRRELIARLSEIEARLVGGLSRTVRMKGERLRDLSRVLPKGDAILAERRQRLDILADRLPRALLAGAQAKRVAYAQRAGGRFGPALLEKRVREERRGVEALGRRLRPDRLSRTIGPGRERLATSAARFDVLGGRLTDRARNRLVALSRLLGTLDYRSFLDRGFVIVRDGAGQVVKSHEDAARQPVLELQFQGDQRLTVFPADKPRPKPAPKRRGEGGGGGTQGSLF
ncbi:MAG: exodeoxyribonuclease VII large subunit, partial [Rubricella sp.]